jgi:hypothetical protein
VCVWGAGGGGFAFLALVAFSSCFIRHPLSHASYPPPTHPLISFMPACNILPPNAENLKTLFRPCAMIRPDILLICENMLFAEGFVQAR